MGSAMLPSAGDASMLSVPSGEWFGRRMAWQKGRGSNSRRNSRRLWNRMYAAKSTGVTSLPMAAMSCLRSMSCEWWEGGGE